MKKAHFPKIWTALFFSTVEKMSTRKEFYIKATDEETEHKTTVKKKPVGLLSLRTVQYMLGPCIVYIGSLKRSSDYDIDLTNNWQITHIH